MYITKVAQTFGVELSMLVDAATRREARTVRWVRRVEGIDTIELASFGSSSRCNFRLQTVVHIHFLT